MDRGWIDQQQQLDVVPGSRQQARRFKGHERPIAKSAEPIRSLWLHFQDQLPSVGCHLLDRAWEDLALQAVGFNSENGLVGTQVQRQLTQVMSKTQCAMEIQERAPTPRGVKAHDGT